MREFLEACYEYIGTIIIIGMLIGWIGENLIEAWGRTKQK